MNPVYVMVVTTGQGLGGTGRGQVITQTESLHQGLDGGVENPDGGLTLEPLNAIA